MWFELLILYAVTGLIIEVWAYHAVYHGDMTDWGRVRIVFFWPLFAILVLVAFVLEFARRA